MRNIYFRIDEELIYFCEMLFRMQDEIFVQWKRDKDWGNVLLLKEGIDNEQDIISCFVDVYLSHRLNRMIKKIAHDYYYYTDPDEIERICQLTNWLMTEKYYMTILFNKDYTLKEFLIFLLKNKIDRDRPIFFDSLVTFGLKKFTESLKLAVGYGIDEMKREEEYQNFIESTRAFIKKRKSKINTLYILQREPFSFFKTNGKEYTKLELRTLMCKEPLYLLGLDESEMNISPILTLLPKEIYIYGDNPSEPKTLTIINMFQERVQFYPRNQFPFI